MVLGPRRLVLGRELTKIHKTVLAGTADDVLAALPEGPVAGEIVIAIDGAPERGAPPPGDEEAGRLIAAWARALAEARGDHRLALRRAARELGVGRAELRRRLAEIGAV